MKIQELEEKIIKAKEAYYAGNPIMSDALFDALENQLAKLDPKNKILNKIGADIVSEWEKYTHLVPMTSLDKKKTEAELKLWAENYCEDNDFFVTLKCDGLSASLVYEKGKLVVGATRGSGTDGENITNNIVKMKNIPLTLSEKVNVTIRGEIMLTKSDWQKHFPDKKNPRNAASGVSRRYDGTGSEHLTFFAYKLEGDLKFNSDVEMFNKLKDLGFTTPDSFHCNSLQEILQYKKDFTKEKREALDIEIDRSCC